MKIALKITIIAVALITVAFQPCLFAEEGAKPIYLGERLVEIDELDGFIVDAKELVDEMVYESSEVDGSIEDYIEFLSVEVVDENSLSLKISVDELIFEFKVNLFSDNFSAPKLSGVSLDNETFESVETSFKDLYGIDIAGNKLQIDPDADIDGVDGKSRTFYNRGTGKVLFLSKIHDDADENDSGDTDNNPGETWVTAEITLKGSQGNRALDINVIAKVGLDSIKTDALSRDWTLDSYGGNYSITNCGNVEIKSINNVSGNIYKVRGKLSLSRDRKDIFINSYHDAAGSASTNLYFFDQEVDYYVDITSGEISKIVCYPDSTYAKQEIAIYADKEVRTKTVKSFNTTRVTTATTTFNKSGLRLKDVGTMTNHSHSVGSTYTMNWEKVYDKEGKFPISYNSQSANKDAADNMLNSSEVNVDYGAEGYMLLQYGKTYRTFKGGNISVDFSAEYDATTHNPTLVKQTGTRRENGKVVSRSTNERVYDPGTPWKVKSEYYETNKYKPEEGKMVKSGSGMNEDGTRYNFTSEYDYKYLEIGKTEGPIAEPTVIQIREVMSLMPNFLDINVTEEGGETKSYHVTYKNTYGYVKQTNDLTLAPAMMLPVITVITDEEGNSVEITGMHLAKALVENDVLEEAVLRLKAIKLIKEDVSSRDWNFDSYGYNYVIPDYKDLEVTGVEVVSDGVYKVSGKLSLSRTEKDTYYYYYDDYETYTYEYERDVEYYVNAKSGQIEKIVYATDNKYQKQEIVIDNENMTETRTNYYETTYSSSTSEVIVTYALNEGVKVKAEENGTKTYKYFYDGSTNTTTWKRTFGGQDALSSFPTKFFSTNERKDANGNVTSSSTQDITYGTEGYMLVDESTYYSKYVRDEYTSEYESEYKSVYDPETHSLLWSRGINTETRDGKLYSNGSSNETRTYDPETDKLLTSTYSSTQYVEGVLSSSSNSVENLTYDDEGNLLSVKSTYSSKYGENDYSSIYEEEFDPVTHNIISSKSSSTQKKNGKMYSRSVYESVYDPSARWNTISYYNEYNRYKPEEGVMTKTGSGRREDGTYYSFKSEYDYKEMDMTMTNDEGTSITSGIQMSMMPNFVDIDVTDKDGVKKSYSVTYKATYENILSTNEDAGVIHPMPFITVITDEEGNSVEVKGLHLARSLVENDMIEGAYGAIKLVKEDVLSRDWNFDSYGYNYVIPDYKDLEITGVEVVSDGVYKVSGKLSLSRTEKDTYYYYYDDYETYTYEYERDVEYYVNAKSGQIEKIVYATDNKYEKQEIVIDNENMTETRTNYYETTYSSSTSEVIVTYALNEGVKVKTEENGTKTYKYFYDGSTNTTTWKRTFGGQDALSSFPTKFFSTNERKDANGNVTSSSTQDITYGTEGYMLVDESTYYSKYVRDEYTSEYESEYKSVYDPETHSLLWSRGIYTETRDGKLYSNGSSNETRTYDPETDKLLTSTYSSTQYVEGVLSSSSNSVENLTYDDEGNLLSVKSTYSSKYGENDYSSIYEEEFDPVTHNIISSKSSSTQKKNGKMYSRSVYESVYDPSARWNTISYYNEYNRYKPEEGVMTKTGSGRREDGTYYSFKSEYDYKEMDMTMTNDEGTSITSGIQMSMMPNFVDIDVTDKDGVKKSYSVTYKATYENILSTNEDAGVIHPMPFITVITDEEGNSVEVKGLHLARSLVENDMIEGAYGAIKLVKEDVLSRDWNFDSYGYNYVIPDYKDLEITGVEVVSDGVYKVSGKLSLSRTEKDTYYYYYDDYETYTYEYERDVEYYVNAKSGQIEKIVYATDNKYEKQEIVIDNENMTETRTNYYETTYSSSTSEVIVTYALNEGVKVKTEENGTKTYKYFYDGSTNTTTWKRTFGGQDALSSFPTKFFSTNERKDANGNVTSSSTQDITYGTEGYMLVDESTYYSKYVRDEYTSEYESEYKSVYDPETHSLLWSRGIYTETRDGKLYSNGSSNETRTYDPETDKLLTSTYSSTQYVEGVLTSNSNSVENRTYDDEGNLLSVKCTYSSKYGENDYSGIYEEEVDPVTHNIISSKSSSTSKKNGKMVSRSVYESTYDPSTPWETITYYNEYNRYKPEEGVMTKTGSGRREDGTYYSFKSEYDYKEMDMTMTNDEGTSITSGIQMSMMPNFVDIDVTDKDGVKKSYSVTYKATYENILSTNEDAGVIHPMPFITVITDEAGNSIEIKGLYLARSLVEEGILEEAFLKLQAIDLVRDAQMIDQTSCRVKCYDEEGLMIREFEINEEGNVTVFVKNNSFDDLEMPSKVEVVDLDNNVLAGSYYDQEGKLEKVEIYENGRIKKVEIYEDGSMTMFFDYSYQRNGTYAILYRTAGWQTFKQEDYTAGGELIRTLTHDYYDGGKKTSIFNAAYELEEEWTYTLIDYKYRRTEVKYHTAYPYYLFCWRKTYDYSDPTQTRIDYYNINDRVQLTEYRGAKINELISKETYEYTDEGHTKTVENADGVMLRKEYYDKEGELVAKNFYDQEGKLVSNEIYGPAAGEGLPLIQAKGVVFPCTAKHYDEDGELIREVVLAEDGKVSSIVTYNVDDPNALPSKVEIIDKDGDLVAGNYYDENGRIKKVEIYEDGSMTMFFDYSYQRNGTYAILYRTAGWQTFKQEDYTAGGELIRTLTHDYYDGGKKTSIFNAAYELEEEWTYTLIDYKYRRTEVKYHTAYPYYLFCWRKTYDYSDPTQTRIDYYNINDRVQLTEYRGAKINELISKETYEYTDEGHTKTVENADGVMLRKEYYDKEGELVAKNFYDQEGKLVSNEIYGPAAGEGLPLIQAKGVVFPCTAKHYDEDGELIREVVLAEDGKVSSIVTYNVDDPNALPSKVEIIDKDGDLAAVNHYDEDGTLVSTEIYKKSDQEGTTTYNGLSLLAEIESKNTAVEASASEAAIYDEPIDDTSFTESSAINL